MAHLALLISYFIVQEYVISFREELLKVVVVPIDATIQLLTRILAVSGSSLVRCHIPEICQVL